MKSLAKYLVMILPIAACVVFWLNNRTTPSKLASAAEFHRLIESDKPTYLRFFANT